jgi:hypothetical protein
MRNDKKIQFERRGFIDSDNVYRYVVQREIVSNECVEIGPGHLPFGTIDISMTADEVLEEVFMTVYTNNKGGAALLSDFHIMQQLTLTDLNRLDKSVVNIIPVGLPPTPELLFFHLDNKNLHSIKLELVPKSVQNLVFTYEFYIDPIDAITPTLFAVSTFFKIRTV